MAELLQLNKFSRPDFHGADCTVTFSDISGLNCIKFGADNEPIISASPVYFTFRRVAPFRNTGRLKGDLDRKSRPGNPENPGNFAPFHTCKITAEIGEIFDSVLDYIILY